MKNPVYSCIVLFVLLLFLSFCHLNSIYSQDSLSGALMSESSKAPKKKLKARKLDGMDTVVANSTDPSQSYDDARAEWRVVVLPERIDFDFSDIEYAKGKTVAFEKLGGIELGDPSGCSFGHRPVYWLIAIVNDSLREAMEKDPDVHRGKQWLLVLGPDDIWRHKFLTRAQVKRKIKKYSKFIAGENNLSELQQYYWAMINKYEQFLVDVSNRELLKELIDMRRKFTQDDYKTLEEFYFLLVKKIPGLGYFQQAFETCLSRLWEHKDDESLFNEREREFLKACEEVLDKEKVDFEAFRNLEIIFQTPLWAKLFMLYFNVPLLEDPKAVIDVDEFKKLLDQMSKNAKKNAQGNYQMWDNSEFVELFSQYFPQLSCSTVSIALAFKFCGILPQLFHLPQDLPFECAFVFSKAAKEIELIHDRLFEIFFKRGMDPYSLKTHLFEVSQTTRIEAEKILERLGVIPKKNAQELSEEFGDWQDKVQFSTHDVLQHGLSTNKKYHYIRCPEWSFKDLMIDDVPAPIFLLHDFAQHLRHSGVLVISVDTQIRSQKMGNVFSHPGVAEVMKKYFGITQVMAGNLHDLVDLENKVDMDGVQEALIREQLQDSSYFCGVKTDKEYTLEEISSDPEIIKEIMGVLYPENENGREPSQKKRSKQMYVPIIEDPTIADLRTIQYREYAEGAIDPQQIPYVFGINIDSTRLMKYVEQLFVLKMLGGLSESSFVVVKEMYQVFANEQIPSSEQIRLFMSIYDKFRNQSFYTWAQDVVKYFYIGSEDFIEFKKKVTRMYPQFVNILEQEHYSFDEFVRVLELVFEFTQQRIDELPVTQQIKWAFVLAKDPNDWIITRKTTRITDSELKRVVQKFIAIDFPAKDWLIELGVQLSLHHGASISDVSAYFQTILENARMWDKITGDEMYESEVQEFMKTCFKKHYNYANEFLQIYSFAPWMVDFMRYLRNGNMREKTVSTYAQKVFQYRDRITMLWNDDDRIVDRILCLREIFGTHVGLAGGHIEDVRQNSYDNDAFQRWVTWFVKIVLDVPIENFFWYFELYDGHNGNFSLERQLEEDRKQYKITEILFPTFPNYWSHFEKNLRDAGEDEDLIRGFTRKFYDQVDQWRQVRRGPNKWWRIRNYLYSIFGNKIGVATGYKLVMDGKKEYSKWASLVSKEVLRMHTDYAKPTITQLRNLYQWYNVLCSEKYAQDKIARVFMCNYPVYWWGWIEGNLVKIKKSNQEILRLRRSFNKDSKMWAMLDISRKLEYLQHLFGANCGNALDYFHTIENSKNSGQWFHFLLTIVLQTTPQWFCSQYDLPEGIIVRWMQGGDIPAQEFMQRIKKIILGETSNNLPVSPNAQVPQNPVIEKVSSIVSGFQPTGTSV